MQKLYHLTYQCHQIPHGEFLRFSQCATRDGFSQEFEREILEVLGSSPCIYSRDAWVTWSVLRMSTFIKNATTHLPESTMHRLHGEAWDSAHVL